MKSCIINYGHTLSGGDTGAEGNSLVEQVVTREIGKELTKILRKEGVTVYESYVDYAPTLNGSLNTQLSQVNAHKVDYVICIHINKVANPQPNGIEIYTYKANQDPKALSILEEFKKIGFNSRGIKQQPLKLVNRGINKTLYLECFFLSNLQDVNLYKKLKPTGVALAIAKGLLNKNISAQNNSSFIKLDGGGKLIDNKPSINLIIRDFSPNIDKIYARVDNDPLASWAFNVKPINNNYVLLEKNCSRAINKRNGGNVFTPKAYYKITATGYSKDTPVCSNTIVLKAPEPLIYNTNYTVQVGRFNNKDYAYNMSKKLKEKGVDNFIKEIKE